MNKYHVKPSGDAGKCRAKKGKCPYGEADEHYASREQAQVAFERNQGGSFGNIATKDSRPTIANLSEEELRKLPKNTMIVRQDKDGVKLYSFYLYSSGMVYLDEPWAGENEEDYDYDIDDYTGYGARLYVGIDGPAALDYHITDRALQDIPTNVKQFLSQNEAMVQEIDTKNWSFSGTAKEKFENFVEEKRIADEIAMQALTRDRDDTWEEYVPTNEDHEHWDIMLNESYTPEFDEDERYNYRKYLYAHVRTGLTPASGAASQYKRTLDQSKQELQYSAQRNASAIVDANEKIERLSKEQENFTEGSGLWQNVESQKQKLRENIDAMQRSIAQSESLYEGLHEESELFTD